MSGDETQEIYELNQVSSLYAESLNVEDSLNFLTLNQLTLLTDIEKTLDEIMNESGAFYFENEGKVEPSDDYQQACQNIKQFATDLKTQLTEKVYSLLKTGIEEVDTEITNNFAWISYDVINSSPGSN